MRNRIRNVLSAATSGGASVLVLGAWGCGVFRNDPTDMANNFRRVLYDEGRRNDFDLIVFAIGDDSSKVNVFRRILS